MSKDIDPGPAIIGIASGVRAISLLCCASLVTFLLIPLCLVKEPESKPKPEEHITIPPAILNTSILTPKKFKMISPTKKDTKSITHTFMAVQRAVFPVLFLESP